MICPKCDYPYAVRCQFSVTDEYVLDWYRCSNCYCEFVGEREKRSDTMIADAKEKKLQEELAFKRDGFLFKTTIFIAGIPLAIYFSSYGGELGRTTWDAIFNGAICGLFIAVAVVVLRLMWRGFTRA